MGIPWLLTHLCKTYRLPLHGHWQVGLPVVIKAAAIAAVNPPVFNDVGHICHPYAYKLWQPETHYWLVPASTFSELQIWALWMPFHLGGTWWAPIVCKQHFSFVIVLLCNWWSRGILVAYNGFYLVCYHRLSIVALLLHSATVVGDSTCVLQLVYCQTVWRPLLYLPS